MKPRPARDAFVVRRRLRIGGLLSGALLIAGLVCSAFIVLTLPWWIGGVFRSVDGPGSALVAVFASGLVLGLPAVVALLAGIRSGNAALRRRVLAMDREGVWGYDSALWWSAPKLVPWRDVDVVRLFTVERVGPEETGPGPTIVPWDHLAFGDPPRTGVHLLWLTATAEEIVAQARRRRPDLAVLDQRTPPPPGLGGRILRRRRLDD